MAKAKSLGKIKTQPKEKVEHKTVFCTGCDSSLTTDKFYKSYNPSHKTGILPYCKECMVKMVTDESGMIDEDLLVEMLRKVDRPYIYTVYESSLEQSETVRGFVGFYMKNIALPQYRSLGFKDSLFLKENEEVVDEKETKKIKSKKDRYKLTMSERNDLLEKWGEYPDEELVRFEKKYLEMSKDYQILTAMHRESLVNYCRAQIKYEIALEKNDISEIKAYYDMAQKTSVSGKLSPNQLSKSDITGGVNSFGEIARVVAKARGIIPIMPRFLRQPLDEIDFALYEYISYNSKLRGLPPPSYEDVYKFYYEKIDEYNERYGADILNGDMGDSHE